jgi:histidinol-phosphate aminotransferase
MAPADVVREVDKVRQPFNISASAQRAASVVLRELGPEIDRLRDLVVSERQRVAQGLTALGLGVAPSDANFLWVDARRPARELADALAAHGVLVRSFAAPKHPGADSRIGRHVRITIGLPQDNDRLLAEMKKCV